MGINKENMKMVGFAKGLKLDFNKLEAVIINIEKQEIFIISKTKMIIKAKIVGMGDCEING